ncbi:MAG: hypothetical protein LBT64_02495 [Puniceicoccales bacterium]|nr:hypothetical protein [Puniceicoccales bacterium]
MALTDGDFASVFFLTTVILFNVRRHICSPKASFISVWGLRISCALLFSFFVNAISHSRKPMLLLATTAILAIFLLESIRLWNLTNIFTKIDIPVFPRFKQCMENFIWPIGKFFDSTRQLILSHGFTEKALLKIGDGETFVMYSPVFYSRDRRSRLQIIFDMLRGGCPLLNCMLTSFTEDGKTIVTNNLQTIFASFYPELWDVRRCPMASLDDLLRIHAHRIEGKAMVKIDDSNSWEAINNEQHQIELANCESGLCEKLEDHNYITLTFSGRYRLWCDMLHYSYFGRPL